MGPTGSGLANSRVPLVEALRHLGTKRREGLDRELTWLADPYDSHYSSRRGYRDSDDVRRLTG